MGGLIRFLLKQDAILDISGYRLVCLPDSDVTLYKVLSTIITDRLYLLAERHGLLDLTGGVSPAELHAAAGAQLELGHPGRGRAG